MCRDGNAADDFYAACLYALEEAVGDDDWSGTPGGKKETHRRHAQTLQRTRKVRRSRAQCVGERVFTEREHKFPGFYL